MWKLLRIGSGTEQSAVVIPITQMEKLRPKVTLREVVEMTQTFSSEVTELNCLLSGTSPLGGAPEAPCLAEGRTGQPGCRS